jgi:hypothetical protein
MTAGLVPSLQGGLADARPRADASNLTSVAFLAVRNERLRTLLDAYLNGPGRRHFKLQDPAAAQVLLADANSASARAALQQSLRQHWRPAVAIASRDPMIDGVVWLPHPFSFEALQRAVAAAQVAAPVQSAAPRPSQRLAVLARTRARSTVRGADAEQASAAARTPFGRRAEGDWTGTAFWLALGLLTIAWLASLLGWRPAVEAPEPRVQQREAPAPIMPDDVLRRAVADSLRDYRAHTPQELADIRRQLESLEAERHLAAEQIERREQLAQLMRPGAPASQLLRDPQRLPAVQMAQARPAEPGAELFQRKLDEAVSRALAQPTSGGRSR